MNNQAKVLIIDDEVDLCNILKVYLEKKNYKVFIANNVNEGFIYLKSEKPDILFLDNNLPDGTGWEMANDIVKENPYLRLFLISAFHPVKPNIDDMTHVKIIEKPISYADIENYL